MSSSKKMHVNDIKLTQNITQKVVYRQPWDMVQNFVTSLCMVDGIERPLRIYYDNNSTTQYFNNNRSTIKSKFHY